MLQWFGEWLVQEWGDGPYRLLSSRLVLASLGFGVATLATWWFLPRGARWLPCDRGREFAVGAELSRGKPTGAGAVFVPIYLACVVLFVPFSISYLEVCGCVLLAMLCGYLDDRAVTAWGNYRKALADVGIAFLTALAICQWQPAELWLPISKEVLVIGPGWYVTIATVLLWVSINATNCTDGVDGLSGSLLLLAFLYLGAILYVVVGHKQVASYLLLPHADQGADWGIMAFTLMGTLLGYLWYNANPSQMLMGDAGSRALGLLLGVFVLATGNPLLIVIVAGVVLVNGATGLLKVALLRFFNIGIFRSVRFPLHDHCRHKWGWSGSQVLLRFMILQAVLTPILIVLLIKVR
ncbi:MAG: phospho-N-acetylmuramoyl-pentapeptide-transferase [Planctomycetota bacterium]